MASNCFELITTKLIDINEILHELKTDEIRKSMEQDVILLMVSLTNENVNEYMPCAWKRLLNTMKDEIAVLSDHGSPKFLTTLLTDAQEKCS
mmetsp:Transcript_31446/g.31702  ORF Transcript_31446/g.31702 Transcript_31446/m.31702 type:complete len:92 (+) Transcript_31446:270-545(+)